jgi:hypothetical protein
MFLIGTGSSALESDPAKKRLRLTLQASPTMVKRRCDKVPYSRLVQKELLLVPVLHGVHVTSSIALLHLIGGQIGFVCDHHFCKEFRCFRSFLPNEYLVVFAYYAMTKSTAVSTPIVLSKFHRVSGIFP